MPKSKRAKVVHLTQVDKKTREHKERLLQTIRDAVPERQHCLVLAVDNMRNSHLQEVRREFDADGRLFFGKARLMARALGQTPAEAVAPGADRLAPFVAGAVGLLLTDRAPSAVRAYFAGLARADFARAGTPATRAFAIPPGVIHSTAGEVPAEHDLPLEHTLEPELRRLGVPTRMVKGRVVLGDPDGRGQPYVVCKEGDVLDSRQTRLLKLFGVCMSEFRVRVVAHWSAATGEVTEVDPSAMEGVDED